MHISQWWCPGMELEQQPRYHTAALYMWSLPFLMDVRQTIDLFNHLSYPHVSYILSCSFYSYQNYCVFLVPHFLEANVFFPTLSHYIQSFLHIALSFHIATRVVLVLFLTGEAIQKVKMLALAVTDQTQVNCCKVNSDSRKQSLFLTKPKADKIWEKAQKGHTRQWLLDWNEQ